MALRIRYRGIKRLRRTVASLTPEQQDALQARNAKRKYVPKEDDDCISLVRWMEVQHPNLKFSHVPQETFTRSWGIKAKNKAKGVRKGIPDYIIYLPSRDANDRIARGVGPAQPRLLFVEMKRARPEKSAIKPEQEEWIARLNTVAGVEAIVCYGYDEAVAAISQRLKPNHQHP